MKIIIKNKVFKINVKKVLRNILVVLSLVIAIKYINNMSSYNAKQIEQYSQFVEYAQKHDLAISQNNYIDYLTNMYN